jgi:uncharacterized repeat protein (TIGR01451 family)
MFAIASPLKRPSLCLGIALILGVGTLLLVEPATSPADHEPQACTAPQQQQEKDRRNLCVRVTDSPDPVAYSVFDTNATWLSYRAVVTNAGNSKLRRVRVKAQLPAGTTLVKATSPSVKCSGRDVRAACRIGSMEKRERVIVDIVVTVPASSDPSPPDTTLVNAVTASFRKHFGHQPREPREKVTYVESTVVSTSAGQTYVPAGRSGKVGTDPEQEQYANTTIPNASAAVLAALRVGPPDTFCNHGKVTIADETYVCRDGGFVDASVTNATTGNTYVNAKDPLVFNLRWDRSLVSYKQTVKNFVVFYQSTAQAPIEVIDRRCDAAVSTLPCLKNVTRLEDGGFSVDLVKQDNGRMR